MHTFQTTYFEREDRSMWRPCGFTQTQTTLHYAYIQAWIQCQICTLCCECVQFDKYMHVCARKSHQDYGVYRRTRIHSWHTRTHPDYGVHRGRGCSGEREGRGSAHKRLERRDRNPDEERHAVLPDLHHGTRVSIAYAEDVLVISVHAVRYQHLTTGRSSAAALLWLIFVVDIQQSTAQLSTRKSLRKAGSYVPVLQCTRSAAFGVVCGCERACMSADLSLVCNVGSRRVALRC
jgi:hypothetical protein